MSKAGNRSKPTSSFTSRIKPKNAKSGGGSAGALSVMFIKIVSAMGMHDNLWNRLMTQYLLDKRNNIPANRSDQASARGNLQKEMFNEKMSWKVFIKSLRFLNVTKFEFIIRPHYPNGDVKECSFFIDVNSNEPDEFSIEEFIKDDSDTDS